MPNPNLDGARSRSLLLLPTTAEIGGLESSVLTLARELQGRGVVTRTVFPRTATSARLLQWSRSYGVPVEVSTAVREVIVPHTLRDMRALRRLVAESRADVVNLHYGGGHISLKDVLAVRLAGRRRCVVSVLHPTPWSQAGERKRWMTRIAALLADAVTTISQATRRTLLEAGVPAERVIVIPCGSRPPAHTPDRAAARAHLGVPEDAFVIGSLARLVPSKGFGDLIDAVTALAAPPGDVHLIIAGDGPEREALERHGRSRLPGRVHFLGRVAETTDVYAAADVFALGSHLEGFGLVFLEAAFYGLPCVGTAVGGVTDIVVDGETGLLVPPASPSALATALRTLRDDPALRRRLGARARERANAEFTEQLMADRYEAVFWPRSRRAGAPLRPPARTEVSAGSRQT
jgi:glycosyltransferase involved in cell wall biosynthesis